MAIDLKMRTPSIRGGIREMGFQHAAAGRGTVLPESNLAKSMKGLKMDLLVDPPGSSPNSRISFFNQKGFG